MKLKDLINLRDNLPGGIKEIIPGDIVLLVCTNKGLKSSGTIDNHKTIYNNYEVTGYDGSCEGFLYIEEV